MAVRGLAVLAVLSLAFAAAAETLVINGSVAGGFVDISTTGTPLGLGDEGVVEIAPGFDLAPTLFAGDGTGRVWVSNNGAVGFLGDDGTAGAFWLNAELPNFALFGGAHGTPHRRWRSTGTISTRTRETSTTRPSARRGTEP
jgi:hypothetical protein